MQQYFVIPQCVCLYKVHVACTCELVPGSMYIVYIMRRVYCVIIVLSYYYRMETLLSMMQQGMDRMLWCNCY